MSTEPSPRPGRMLGLSVDRGSELPVGVQLGIQLRALIAGARLRPGQRLPGVRELADATGINVNTARAVYVRLEGEGWLTSRQGRGTHVAAEAPSRPELIEVIAAFEAQVARLGLGQQELAAALYLGSQALRREPEGNELEEGSRGHSPSARDDEREQRRALRREITQLEDELQHAPRLEPEPDVRGAAGQGARLLDAAQLRLARDDLRRRLAERRQAHGHFREEIAQVRAEIEQDNRAYLAHQTRRAREATGTSTSNRHVGPQRIAWTY